MKRLYRHSVINCKQSFIQYRRRKLLRVERGSELDSDNYSSYTVKFFDGVVKTINPTKVKPYKLENVKAQERDITQGEQSNGKGEAKVNGKAESYKSKKGSSDLEEEESRKDEEEKTRNGNIENSGQNGNLNGEEGETGAGELGQEGVGEQTEKPQVKKDGLAVQAERKDRQAVQAEREDGKVVQAEREDGKVVQTEREDVNVGGECVMSSNQRQEEKERDVSGQSSPLNWYRPSEES
ncbi:sodium/potassium/calcium exchanger 1-like [Oncorhynchus mykiss]|uniref:sodium/potassium/calcium exchanger 1-like n=1 Tax=Oncorhynchus mykiss TaxID=8022 RepID=UPI00187835E9|nr:sodium/potassium/calcium exchanger 1-like [Oncorhynchus mykiss]